MLIPEQEALTGLCDIGRELIQKENPLDASKSGQNTVFHYCEVSEQRESYAACLWYLEAHARGDGQLRPDCEVAVNNKTCPARRMRMLELREDRALFYVNYKEITEARQAKWALEDEESVVQFRKKKDRKFIPITVIPTDDISDELDLSEAKRGPALAPTRLEDQEIETNLMEKLVRKKLNDANNT